MSGTNIAVPMTRPDATNSPYGTSVPGTLSTSRPTPNATPRSIATGSMTMNARAYFQKRMNASQCLIHSADMLRGLMPSTSRTSGLPRAAQSCWCPGSSDAVVCAGVTDTACLLVSQCAAGHGQECVFQVRRAMGYVGIDVVGQE